MYIGNGLAQLDERLMKLVEDKASLVTRSPDSTIQPLIDAEVM
jgi:hypothetical protein